MGSVAALAGSGPAGKFTYCNSLCFMEGEDIMIDVLMVVMALLRVNAGNELALRDEWETFFDLILPKRF